MAPRSIYETEDLAAIRALTRRFVEEEVTPKADPWEEEGVPREVLRRMGDIGFFGLRVPEDRGGIGMGPLASLVFAEELGRSTFGGFSATAIVHTDLAMPYLLNFGGEHLWDRYLPGSLTGEIIGAIGVTEPDAGTDVAGMRTTATRDGEGYRLNGSKMYITNGINADVVYVAAKTNPTAKPSRGISIFAIDRGTGGFGVSRALKKMGWRSSDTALLTFDDCWVPEAQLVGDLDKGFYAIMANFQNERLVLGGMALGESQKAIELTIDYVKNRRAFGASLWTKQRIRLRLAELQAKVEAGRQLTYHAGWLMEQGVDATREVSMVKAFVGELVNEVLYACTQFHGGMGFIQETAIERMYRDARIHSIGGGATEVMLEEIAKRS
ncbi:MAG: acyl-CoA dehydrogenase family protein [Acidimicrobiia bacterium]